MSNESAVRLVRGLAFLMRPNSELEVAASLLQADPEMDELRRLACEILQERAGYQPVFDSWRPFIDKYGLSRGLADKDERLIEEVRVQAVAFIGNLGPNATRMIRGYGYEHIVQSGNALSQDDVYSPSALLHDIGRGFQGRTTSRLEDETICLAIMLRIRDMKRLLAIEPLPWRWKKLLDAVKPNGFRGIVNKCHEKRMKKLLLQLEASKPANSEGAASRGNVGLPTSIIFWNTPRLPTFGWAGRHFPAAPRS